MLASCNPGVVYPMNTSMELIRHKPARLRKPAMSMSALALATVAVMGRLRISTAFLPLTRQVGAAPNPSRVTTAVGMFNFFGNENQKPESIEEPI
jgi:hypothetical protein